MNQDIDPRKTPLNIPIPLHPSEADLDPISADHAASAVFDGVAPMVQMTDTVASLDTLECRRMRQAFRKAAGSAATEDEVDEMRAAFAKARPGTTPESIGAYFGLERT